MTLTSRILVTRMNALDVILKRGQIVLAGGTRHNEECRQRVYQEMREAGTEKLKRADLEHASRTQTQNKKSGKKVEEAPNLCS